MALNANEIEAAIDEIADELKVAQSKLDRLRAIASQPEVLEQPLPVPVAIERCEIAASAFRRHGFLFNDLKVQRTCRDHAGDGGFAIKLGVWNVKQPQFDVFAEQVKCGAARF
ncbi:MAG: hypothetical protein J0G36_19580 [Afipia sp.]|nr:hypothetical protein [Afipia sp.]